MEISNIDVLISQYLSYCRLEKGLDPKTIKAYEIDLRQFRLFILPYGSTLSRESLQMYLTTLHENYSIKSVKRKMATLKAFFNYLEYEEILEFNPIKQMRIKLHEPYILPRVIPLSSIELLLQHVYKQKNITFSSTYQHRFILRDIAVLELLFATGVRVSELCSIRKDAFNLSSGELKVYGKGAKERLIQVSNPSVLSACFAYYRANATDIDSSNWFFINRLGNPLSDQSVRNMITKYASQVGIKQHITPHMFRHTFATMLLEEDVDIRYIQHLLGHSSITTTQIYTHVTTKKQRDILSNKHPRNKIAI